MNVDFTLPTLGENIASGDVVAVLVREGDRIAANDGVIEIETDKAVVEVPCPHPGKVTKVLVSKGQTIKVGQPLLKIEVEAPATESKTPSEKPRSADAEAKSGAGPHPSPLPEGEGTKGKLPEGEGTSVKPRPAVAEAKAVVAGPEARRLARELGVELAKVSGSGKRGRITVDDVRAAAGQTAQGPAPSSEEPQPSPSDEGIPAQRGTREPAVPPGELAHDAYGPVRRQQMPRIRRTIAAQMVKSATTIPHVTNFDDADVTELERIRKTIPPAYLGPTIKLTAMSFAIRSVALALRQHPLLNASLDEEKQEIIYKQYVNIGVAVDTPRGLVVPVLRDADRMGVVQIARELTLLAARARSAEFGVNELRGGTFTISNLGAVGGVYSTPIINHPEVAILLLGRTRWMLSVFEGKIEGRLMMPLSLSFDHRVVDGAAAGRFLNDVIDSLQSPGRMLVMR